MSDFENRVRNIQKRSKGISDFVTGINVADSDPSWTGSIKTLTSSLIKLSEVASTLKQDEIHYKNYYEILNEGTEMIVLVDAIVREALKKTLLKRNPKRKKEISWVSTLVISYAQLLGYITNPKKAPTFDLDKFFGAGEEAKKFVGKIWNDTSLVAYSKFSEEYSELSSKYKPKPKDIQDRDKLKDAEVVSPVLLAAILGPNAELKNLREYKKPLYAYKEVEEEVTRNVVEYKSEDDSKYFYIVSHKFDEKKINGKELSTLFCLTPESK